MAREIEPTLIIGLGGTGKEVLLKIRKAFYESYGFVKMPTFRYMWIDTTGNAKSAYDPDDHIAQAIAFTSDEIVHTKVNKGLWKELRQNPTNHAHIHSWLPEKVFSLGHSEIVNGAGQYRALGKLALYMNYKEIANRIASVCRNMMTQEAANETQEISGGRFKKKDQGINVIVVMSAAGGTGSGMLIDIPYVIRNLSPSILGTNKECIDHIRGYLLMPTVYLNDQSVNFPEGQKERIQANAYACLSELEYYTRRFTDTTSLYSEFKSNVFKAQWDPELPPVEIKNQPYDACYLVGGSPQDNDNVIITSANDAFDMMADTIWLRFQDSSFNDVLKDMASNETSEGLSSFSKEYPVLGGKYKHRETYTCAFSSIGLAKIYIDRLRFRHIAAYGLAIKVLKAWINKHEHTGDEAQEAFVAEQAQQLAQKLGLEHNSIYSGLIKNMDAVISTKLNETDVGPATLSGIIDSLMSLSDDTTDASKKFNERIHQYAQGVLAKLKPLLQDLVITHGVEPCKNILRQLYDSIKETEQSMPIVTLSFQSDDVREAVAWLNDAENVFLSGLWKFDTICKERAVSQVLAFKQRSIADLTSVCVKTVLATFEKQIRESYINIAENTEDVSLMDRLQSYLQQLLHSDERDSRNGSEYQKKGLVQIYSDLIKGQHFQRNIQLKEELLQEKKLWIETVKSLRTKYGDGPEIELLQKTQKVILTEIATMLVEDIALNNVIDLVDVSCKIQSSEVRNKIIKVCYDCLDNFLKDVNVVDELTQLGDVKTAVERIVANSSPYMTRNVSSTNETVKTRRYLGYNQGKISGDASSQVQEVINHEGATPVNHNKDEIVGFSYNLKLSLHDLSIVDEFYKIYSNFADRYQFHTDKEYMKFPSVHLVDVGQIAHRVDALENVLFAIIINKIVFDHALASFTFKVKEQFLGRLEKKCCGSSNEEIVEYFAEKRHILTASKTLTMSILLLILVMCRLPPNFI